MNTQFTTLGQSASVSVSEVDGEVLINLSCYPVLAQACLPLDVALKVADEITAIARKQLKEAA